MLTTIGLFERWSKEFPVAYGVHEVKMMTPSNNVHTQRTFLSHKAKLTYDRKGYEHIESLGDRHIEARYTPVELGIYHWKALTANFEVIEEGSFTCVPSEQTGYVRISPRDSRYFETSDGSPYCVIGINLCLPPSYPLSAGCEFQTLNQTGTLGLLDYRRWFQEFSENGGNFVRIWLSSAYFEPESETAGSLELEKFVRIDGLVELARTYNIRLKFCLEHFRTIGPVSTGWSGKGLKHPETGQSPANMGEWFLSKEWQTLWWKKVHAYVDRYGGDPTVMAWELWNEINACQVSDWSIVRDWTSITTAKLQELVPEQLVVNSLGSYDRAIWDSVYKDFHMDELAFQQVHRYLDFGAELDVCHDNIWLGIDAVVKSRRHDRPVLLAETGAVNDDHTGPFTWYRADHQGVIFHDCVFPAFFAGAAGIGQIWHWDEYVDKKNLWPMFKPFHSLINHIDLPAEQFTPFQIAESRFWTFGLKGNRHVLGMVRLKNDDWDQRYLHNQPAVFLNEIEIDLSEFAPSANNVELFSVWEQECPPNAAMEQGKLFIRSIRSSVFFKIILEDQRE